MSHLEVLLQTAGMHTGLPFLVIKLLPKQHIGLQRVVDNPGLLGNICQLASHAHSPRMLLHLTCNTATPQAEIATSLLQIGSHNSEAKELASSAAGEGRGGRGMQCWLYNV